MIIYTYSVYFESMIKYKKTYEVNIILEHIQCLHKPILKYSRFLDVLKQGNAYLLSLNTGYIQAFIIQNHLIRYTKNANIHIATGLTLWLSFGKYIQVKACTKHVQTR